MNPRPSPVRPHRPLVLAALGSALALVGPAAAQPLEPAAGGDEEVHVVYLPPGCLGSGSVNINLLTLLFEHFETRDGSIAVTASGSAPLTDGTRYLFPAGMTDLLGAASLLQEEGALRREVVEAGLPVLVSPFEINFQYPWKGHHDLIRVIEAETRPLRRFPDTTRVVRDLVRYTDPSGRSVLALEPAFGAAGEPDRDLLAWGHTFGAEALVRTADDEVHLYVLGRRLYRGSRVPIAVDGLRGPAGRTFVLHAGDVAPDEPNADDLAHCGSSARDLGLTAVVPREQDLALGAEGLSAFVTTHGLPMVAANLRAGKDRPFPRFSLRRAGALTVAVIGIVGRDQLLRLPASVREEWEVEQPDLALERTVRDLRDQLGRRPDLTVVLAGTGRGEDLAEAQSVPGVDLVVGLFDRWDLLATTERIEVPPDRAGREGVRNQQPLLTVRSGRFSVGRVTARFSAPQDGVHRLRGLVHERRTVFEDAEADPALERRLRELGRADAKRKAGLALPDVAEFVESRPELHPLVWGPRILHRTAFRSYERPYPARFSDPLWMRLVTNLLRTTMGAEVALSRNLPRSSDMVGAVSRSMLGDWARAADSVRVVTLTGAQLSALAGRLRRQEEPDAVPATASLFASGLDSSRERVGGRALVPEEGYRVATTDFVLSMPEVISLLGRPEAAERFVPRPGGAWVEEPEGAPLVLASLIRSVVEGWAAPGTRDFDPGNAPALRDLLLDHSGRLEGRWSLRVDELSLSGASYANTDNFGVYATTRETRVSTPDNLSLMGRGELALLYDGPAVAWETGSRASFQRVSFPDLGIRPQEPVDDLVSWTELRLNVLRLGVGEADVPLVPFLRAEYDTELTATLDQSAEDLAAAFPRQQLVRGSLGVTVRPGGALREVRLGLLGQADLSVWPEAHADGGVAAGARARLPLIGPLAWATDLDLRYLVPDGDDRPADLGTVLSWVNKLVAPVGGGLSLFVMADLWLARGKLPGADDWGGSWILGGGVQFERVFKP